MKKLMLALIFTAVSMTAQAYAPAQASSLNSVCDEAGRTSTLMYQLNAQGRITPMEFLLTDAREYYLDAPSHLKLMLVEIAALDFSKMNEWEARVTGRSICLKIMREHLR